MDGIMFPPVGKTDADVFGYDCETCIGGRIDIAAGNYTIRSERKKIVDFSQPFAMGAIIVAAKGTSNLNELEDRRG